MIYILFYGYKLIFDGHYYIFFKIIEGMIQLDMYIFDDDDRCGDDIDTDIYSMYFDIYVFHICWYIYVLCFDEYTNIDE